MLIRPIFVAILAASAPINSLHLQQPTPINDPITVLVELPPLSEVIATEPAVRLNPPDSMPPITESVSVYEFSNASANGRCIGAEGLLSKYKPGWNIERMSRIMYRESRCNPAVRNRQSGSTGLLQIMPSNCRYIANQLGESCSIAKLQQPDFNIRAATTLFEYDGYGPWKL